MLIIEQGQMEPNRVIIKKDWSPERIGRAHRSSHTITRAEEFMQDLLMPRVLPAPAPARPVEITPNLDHLVEFLNR